MNFAPAEQCHRDCKVTVLGYMLFCQGKLPDIQSRALHYLSCSHVVYCITVHSCTAIHLPNVPCCPAVQQTTTPPTIPRIISDYVGGGGAGGPHAHSAPMPRGLPTASSLSVSMTYEAASAAQRGELLGLPDPSSSPPINTGEVREGGRQVPGLPLGFLWGGVFWGAGVGWGGVGWSCRLLMYSMLWVMG